MTPEHDCTTNVLDSDSIIGANALFQLDDKRLQKLLELAGAFRRNEQARTLAERFHALFYHSEMDKGEAGVLWTSEGACLGTEQSGMAALLVMSGSGHLENYYQERKIPRNILIDSLKDLAIWMDDHYENTGETGLVEVSWLLHAMRGELFRLGRLQFVHQPLAGNITVATRRSDGLSVLFFTEPVQLREDGQVDGTNGIHSPHPFLSEFSQGSQDIYGTPVHPCGYALNRAICLDGEQWDIAVKPGDGSLDIHIPKDGKMSLEQCCQSLLAAQSFFATYFPEKQFDVFTLCTWFLDAQLQRILPKDANIVRFQREFYLYPVLSDEKFAYGRVFGNPEIDIAQAPEDTSLRKSIKQFVMGGGKMRFSSGIILKKDLPLLGTAQYQEQCAGMVEELVGG